MKEKKYLVLSTVILIALLVFGVSYSFYKARIEGNTKSISLKTTKETMNIGEGKTIYAQYNPSNVKDKTLYWISSNEKVVTVSEGNVKAVGKGTATITAVSRDGGKTATCEITVK